MKWVVFYHELKHRWTSVIAWIIGICLYGFLLAYFWPSLKDQLFSNKQLYDAFIKMLENPVYKPFIGRSGLDFFTPEGFLFTEYYSVIGPIALGFLAINMGAELVGGEEERKTLELVATSALSRIQLFAEKAAALVVAVLFVSLTSSLGFIAGNAVVDMEVAATKVVYGSLVVGLMALAFGAVAMAAGGICGRRGPAVGVGYGFLFLQFALYTLGMVAEKFNWVGKLSLFYYAVGDNMLRTGYVAEQLWVSAFFAVLVLCIGGLVFTRRDLKSQ